MDRARFIYFEGEDGQWYWHLQDKNGKINAQGEGYVSESNVKRGINDTVDAFMEALGVVDVFKGIDYPAKSPILSKEPQEPR